MRSVRVEQTPKGRADVADEDIFEVKPFMISSTVSLGYTQLRRVAQETNELQTHGTHLRLDTGS